MLQDARTNEVRSFTFGAIAFQTRGLAVFFPSEKLHARIRELSRDQLQAANQAAWKLRRKCERAATRHAGDSHMNTWESAAHDAHVAEQICKATWSALKSN